MALSPWLRTDIKSRLLHRDGEFASPSARTLFPGEQAVIHVGRLAR